MEIILNHGLFFLVGIFQDLLITYYYQVIAKEQAWRAASSSFLVTIVNISVLYELVGRVDSQVPSVIGMYALGNAVGTFIVIKRHELKKAYAVYREGR